MPLKPAVADLFACPPLLCLCVALQDGRIDYNEFVAMMQKPTMGLPKKAGAGGLQNSFSIGFREALRMS